MARSNPGFQVIVSLADKFTRPIDGLNKKIGGASAKLKQLAAMPGRFAAALQLGKVGSAAANVGKSVLNLRNAIAGTIAPFARLGVLAGGIGLGVMVKDAVSAGAELIKLSAQTRVSVEDLQRMQYAAKQENLSADAFVAGIKKMNAVMVAAQKPAKKMTEQQLLLTKGLGFSAQAVRAGAIDPLEAYLRLADRVAAAKPEDRTRIAVAALGKGYAEHLPLLIKGRQAILDSGAGAAVMSDKMAQSSKQFGDTMTTLAEHAKGVAYAVLDELLPSMNAAAGGTDNWIEANKPEIVADITAVIRDLVEIFKAAYEVLKRIVPIVKAVLTPAWEALTAVLGEGNAKMLVFGAIVAPKVLGAVYGLAKSLSVLAFAVGKSLVLALGFATKAAIGFGIALLANPIGLAIAGIAALAAAVFLIYKYWEPITEFFASLWAGVKKVFWAVVGWIGDFYALFIPEPIKRLWNALGGFWGIWDKVKETFWAVIGWIGDFVGQFIPEPIKKVWEALGGFWGIWDLVRDSFYTVFTWYANFLAQFIPEPIKKVWESLTSWFDDNWADIKAAFDDPIKWLAEFVGKFIPQPIKDAWGTVAKFFEDVWKGVVSWFDWAWEKIRPIVDFIAGAISKVTGGFKWLAGKFGWGGGEQEAPATPAEAAAAQAVAAEAAPAARPQPTARAPAGQAAAGARAVAQQQVAKAQIDVRFANVPQGTRIGPARTEGNVEVNLRSEYAGPHAPAAAY